MTLESFRRAEEIVKAIEDIDKEIAEVHAIKRMVGETGSMRVYSETLPARFYDVDHCGLLPKFLEEIVDVLQERHDKLLAKLAML